MSIEQSNNSISDTNIWKKFIAGNDTAYKQIYQKYAGTLFSAGLKYTSDEDLIKDTIHDLFIYIYNARNNLGIISNIRLYLITALRNRLYNSLTRGNRAILIAEEKIMESKLPLEETIEHALIKKEDQQVQENTVKGLLSELTQRQKEVVHYRFYESMTIEEISVLMGINQQSVQNLLQRSLQKIEESLKKVGIKEKFICL